MQIKDQSTWDRWVANNQDSYGKAIIDYAERWADLMEEMMANGQTLEAIAESTSYTADTEGITGFMYGAAVSVLATSWEHGEKLRRWHNKEIQLDDEGDIANEGSGVLNPALLTVK